MTAILAFTLQAYAVNPSAALSGDLSFTTPAAGDIIDAKSNYTITWQHKYKTSETVSYSDFILSYSTDGGNTWQELYQGRSNSYDWSTPDISNSSIKLRLERSYTSAGMPGTIYKETGSFTIKQSTTMTPSPLLPGSIYNPLLSKPNPPEKLTAVSGSTGITLTWTDKADNESGFKLDRKLNSSGTFETIADIMPNVTKYTDTSASAEKNFIYRVKAYNSIGDSEYSNEAGLVQKSEPEKTDTANTTSSMPAITASAVQQTASATEIKFYINKNEYYINGKKLPMDAAPVVKNGRTFIPVRYLTDALGAKAHWNDSARLTTISYNGKTINLKIDSGQALINGTSVAIDPENPAVAPIIAPPGRTMLPLRFIAENLACEVKWNAETGEIKITQK